MSEPGAGRRILVVDDDADVLVVTAASLRAHGYEVATAGSAGAARRWIERHGLPHLAVVDILMPEVDGIELCKEIHSYCDLPVVLLTSVEDSRVVVRSLREVAEDYVVKPFDPEELAARVERVLRRLDFPVDMTRRTPLGDGLAVDFVGRRAEVDGQAVALTPTETKLLHILARRPRRPVGVDFLLRRLWPLEEVFEDSLRVHVHRLRKKIERDPARPRYLLTERGLGYRLEVGR